MKTARTDGKLRKNATGLLIIMLIMSLILNVAGAARVVFIDGDRYRQEAENQQLSDTTVTAPRGIIYDTNMTTLAESASAWLCCATPTQIHRDETRKKIAKFFSELFNIEYDTVLSKVSNEESQYVIIQKKVTATQKAKAETFLSENSLDGVVYFTPDSLRCYSEDNFASTVLGFTNIDSVGAAGVELQYNSTLTGTTGRIITAKDAKSNSMTSDYETVVDAQEGNGVVLTIDSNIQHYLEKALTEAKEDYEAKATYGIVMDVKTCAVLAMSNKPDYDTNNAYTIADKSTLKALKKIKNKKKYAEAYNEALFEQWNNKCISYQYEPGSVFKIFTLSAGIEEGVVNESSTYTCTGGYNIGGWTIHCAHTEGHGTQNLRQGLMNSCNPFFISIGQSLGTETYYKYFEAFGFTEKTGIDLPGEAEPVAGVTYHDPDNFTKTNLASTSYGQTFKVSPIQVITAACAIANGGKLMQPYIVKATVDEKKNVLTTTEPVVKRQVISASTAAKVCSMMESVVTDGTGKNAYIAGYHVAGKTATSEKIAESKSENKKLYSGSFVCFAPADDPQVAVLIVTDEPGGVLYGGSLVAAPVAKEVLENTLTYLNVEPEYNEKELATLSSTAPNLVGSKVESAAQTAANSGYSTKVMGKGETVVSQTPAAGQTIPAGGVIILYTESGNTDQKVKMPDFTYMTISQANQLAVQTGVNISFSGPSEKTGSMQAYKQSIEKDESVPAGTTVTVYFKETGSSIDDRTN